MPSRSTRVSHTPSQSARHVRQLAKRVGQASQPADQPTNQGPTRQVSQTDKVTARHAPRQRNADCAPFRKHKHKQRDRGRGRGRMRIDGGERVAGTPALLPGACAAGVLDVTDWRSELSSSRARQTETDAERGAAQHARRRRISAAQHPCRTLPVAVFHLHHHHHHTHPHRFPFSPHRLQCPGRHGLFVVSTLACSSISDIVFLPSSSFFYFAPISPAAAPFRPGSWRHVFHSQPELPTGRASHSDFPYDSFLSTTTTTSPQCKCTGWAFASPNLASHQLLRSLFVQSLFYPQPSQEARFDLLVARIGTSLSKPEAAVLSTPTLRLRLKA